MRIRSNYSERARNVFLTLYCKRRLQIVSCRQGFHAQAFGGFTVGLALRELYLGACQLRRLPLPLVGDLVALRRLHLWANELDHLPSGMFSQPGGGGRNLVELSLWGNRALVIGNGRSERSDLICAAIRSRCAKKIVISMTVIVVVVIIIIIRVTSMTTDLQSTRFYTCKYSILKATSELSKYFTILISSSFSSSSRAKHKFYGSCFLIMCTRNPSCFSRITFISICSISIRYSKPVKKYILQPICRRNTSLLKFPKEIILVKLFS